jgi:hypothetical protein
MVVAVSGSVWMEDGGTPFFGAPTAAIFLIGSIAKSWTQQHHNNLH